LLRRPKKILPKRRKGPILLEQMLRILMEKESPVHDTLKGICREALKYKSVPEGLIPELKALRDYALKTHKSRIAKQNGKLGGIKSAQKRSQNKASAEKTEARSVSLRKTDLAPER
jgi:hypothetical protein